MYNKNEFYELHKWLNIKSNVGDFVRNDVWWSYIKII